MTLEDWRLEEGVTYARLAELISTKDHKVSEETVRRWCLSEDHQLSRTPSRAEMRRVYAVTHGAVTPNDFAGL